MTSSSKNSVTRSTLISSTKSRLEGAEQAEQLETLARQNNVSEAREMFSHLGHQIATLTRALQESLAVER